MPLKTAIIKYEENGSVQIQAFEPGTFQPPICVDLTPEQVSMIAEHDRDTGGVTPSYLLPDTEINCLVVHAIPTVEGGFERIAIPVSPNMTVGELLNNELGDPVGVGYRKTSHVELRLARGIK